VSAPAISFRRATRQAVKLKIGIQGPSGSGKTLGALALARGLAGKSGRIAFIDTENDSASLYADRYEFDTLGLSAPYESRRYVEAIRAAAEAGYHVVIVDSLSHQWAGPGGILDRKEQADKRGGNQFTNWQPFTKEHEAFKAELLAAPVHLICCLRTKQDYVLEEKGGKQAPKKVGLAAIQREGMEYEFSINFELQMDHRASASKDRTSLFDEQLSDLTNPDVAKKLRAWLATAEQLAEEARPVEAKPSTNGAALMPFGPDELRGLPITDERISADLLVSAIDWIAKDSARTEKFAQFSAQATALLPEKLRAAPTEKLEKIGRWANKEERIAEYQWLIDLLEAESSSREPGEEDTDESSELEMLRNRVGELLRHPACFVYAPGIMEAMPGLTVGQLRTQLAELESHIQAKTKKPGGKQAVNMGDSSIPGATNA
jgi:hypothetical protein